MHKAILAIICVLSLCVGRAVAKEADCTTIPEGRIADSRGNPVAIGYDEYGYDYQKHVFDGRYCDADRVKGDQGDEPCDVKLVMKWNNAWMSNKSCDGDRLLDRHFGHDSYVGSGAWLTNHQSGTYIGDDGKEHKWTYFVKIAAVPTDATLSDGVVWFDKNGNEIGLAIWGVFVIIQEVFNDPCLAEHDILYKSPVWAGFGNW